MLESLLLSTKKIIKYGKLFKFGRPTNFDSSTTSISAVQQNYYWKYVSSGPKHTVAIRADGTLWGWGLNIQGTLGLPILPENDFLEISSDNPVQIGSSNKWVKAEAGETFTVGIQTDGSLYTWGSNNNSEFGQNIYLTSPDFIQVKFCDMSNSAIAIKKDGSVWVWGSNILQEGNSQVPPNIPVSPSSVGTVRGVLGLEETNSDYFSEPQRMFVGHQYYSETVFTKVAVYDGSFFAIDQAGRLFTWGNNTYGRVGDPNIYGNVKLSASIIDTSDMQMVEAWVDVACGDSHAAGVTASGRLYVWGSNVSQSLPETITYETYNGIPIVYRPKRIGAYKYLQQYSNEIIENDPTNPYDNVTIPHNTDEAVFTKVAITRYTTYLLTNEGKLFGFGDYSRLPYAHTTKNYSSAVYNANTGFYNVNDWSLIGSIVPGIGPYYVISDERMGPSNSPLFVIRITEDPIAPMGFTVELMSGPIQAPFPFSYATFNWGTGTLRLKISWSEQYGGYLMDRNSSFPQQVSCLTFSEITAGRMGAAFITTSMFSNGSSVPYHSLMYIGNLYSAGPATWPVQCAVDNTYPLVTKRLTHFDIVSGNGLAFTSEDPWANNISSYPPLTNSYTQFYTSMKFYNISLSTSGASLSIFDNADFTNTGRNTKFYIAGRAWNIDGVSSSLGNNYSVTTNYQNLASVTITDTSSLKSVTQSDSGGAILFDSGYNAQRDYGLYTWGSNLNGILGRGANNGSFSPEKIAGLEVLATEVPFKLIGYGAWKDVAAGYRHVVAVTSDNKLYSWGSNTYNQAGVPNTDNNIYGTIKAPYELTGYGSATGLFEKAYANGNLSGAISTSGVAYIWGQKSHGNFMTDINDVQTWIPLPLPITSKVKKLSFASTSDGYVRIAALIKSSDSIEGEIWTWGNEHPLTTSDLTTGISARYLVPEYGAVQASSSNSTGYELAFAGFKSISYGTEIPVAYGIKTDGSLWAWGNNINGNIPVTLRGTPAAADWTQPTRITVRSIFKHPVLLDDYEFLNSSRKWKKVVTNGKTTLAIGEDNKLYGWGDGTYLQLPGKNTFIYDITLLDSDPFWVDIAIGKYHAIGIKGSANTTDKLYTWGTGSSFTSGGLQIVEKPYSTYIPKKIACGYYHAIVYWNNASDTDGKITTIGDNQWGQLGVAIGTNTANSHVLVASLTTSESSKADVYAGYYNSAYKKYYSTNNTERLYTVGDNRQQQLGYDATQPKRVWTRIAVGADFAIAIEQGTNKLYGWGSNAVKQLADYTDSYTASPVLLSNDSWIHITVGYQTAMGIKSDGTLWVWGSRTEGQSATNSTTGYISFTQITTGNATTWTNVKLGRDHGLATRSDGTLWGWGYNVSGQVGDNTNTYRGTPVQIGSSSNWSTSSASTQPEWKLAAGYWQSYAINTSGAMYGWGYNNRGQVGDGTTTNKKVPTLIGSSGWDKVRSNANISTLGMAAAIKTDGYLYTWGSNINLKLGQGGNGASYITTPTQLGYNNYEDIAIGEGHVIAMSGGYLYWWGTTTNGESGHLTTSNGSTSTPQRLTYVTDRYSKVWAGQKVSFGTTQGGYQMAWGQASQGQNKLGIGYQTYPSDVNTPQEQGGRARTFAESFEMAVLSNYTRELKDLAIGPNHMMAALVDTQDTVNIPNRTLAVWGFHVAGSAGSATYLPAEFDPNIFPSKVVTGYGDVDIVISERYYDPISQAYYVGSSGGSGTGYGGHLSFVGSAWYTTAAPFTFYDHSWSYAQNILPYKYGLTLSGLEANQPPLPIAAYGVYNPVKAIDVATAISIDRTTMAKLPIEANGDSYRIYIQPNGLLNGVGYFGGSYNSFIPGNSGATYLSLGKGGFTAIQNRRQ